MDIIKLNKFYKPKIIFKNKIFSCQLGANGIFPNFKKIEGDFSTPKGKWKLGKIFYRKDKLPFIKIKKFQRKNTFYITKKCGWCDDLRSNNYNKYIKLNEKKSINVKYEEMHRCDDAYDIVIEIKYNKNPTIKGKGSAIFIHCSFMDKRSTKGCVAISKKELIYILKKLEKGTIFKIM